MSFTKIISLPEAVAKVKHGTFLAFGGMTIYRKPMSFVRELVRQQIGEIKLLSFSGSIDVDMLISAGLIREIRTCYTGFEFLGLAPAFRKGVEKGLVKLVEETELTIAGGLLAQLQGVSFYAVKGLLGTDILKVRPDLQIINSPVNGEKTVLIPSFQPEIAVIHVQRCDVYGNAQLEGQYCIDRELAAAAEMVILIAERLVGTEDLVNSPAKAQIVNFDVDYIVPQKFGAHPTSCYPYYTYDLPHLMEYLTMTTRNAGEYLQSYIMNSSSEEEYLDQVINPSGMLDLLY